MQGIVKQVQSNGSINLKHGLFYKYAVSIQSDNQNKFIQGEEVNFEFTGGNYPKIKPINPEYSNKQSYSKPDYSSDRETRIIRQSTLKCATDYICNNGGDKADVIELAEMLTDWVLTGKKVQKTDTNSDLPF